MLMSYTATNGTAVTSINSQETTDNFLEIHLVDPCLFWSKRFDESRFSHYPLSWESAGMVERIKNLFSFNFIDAEERNTSLHKKIKNWILVVFRTCIIYKLTASCLRLSFHLTFKFLVLQTNHQFFPLFF